MRKETSTLYFKRDTIEIFFSGYKPVEALDNEELNTLADMYFCLNSYEYIWLFRELKSVVDQESIDNIFKVENASFLTNKAIQMFKSAVPDIGFRTVEMHAFFKEFLAMTDEELADYATVLLSGVGIDE